MDTRNTMAQGALITQDLLAAQGFRYQKPWRLKGDYNHIALDSGGAYGKFLPIRIISAKDMAITVYAKDEVIEDLILAYAWNVYDIPRLFLTSYTEALDVLGKRITTKPAWIKHRFWSTTNPSPEHLRLMATYQDRWDWLQRKFMS